METRFFLSLPMRNCNSPISRHIGKFFTDPKAIVKNQLMRSSFKKEYSSLVSLRNCYSKGKVLFQHIINFLIIFTEYIAVPTSS